MQRFAVAIAEVLSKVLNETVLPGELATPPDPKLGDFAYPCFQRAKSQKKNPAQVATELKVAVAAHDDFKTLSTSVSVLTAGPYLNFLIDTKVAAETLLPAILHGTGFGDHAVSAEKRGTWIVEYSSPNVAKPFLIGHLRSTALGAALARTAKQRGWNVVRINHLGDWGTQYGKLAVALKRYGQLESDALSIDELVKIYVRFHADLEKHPELETEAREAFSKLENGDPEVTRIWKKCVEISLKEFKRVYELLGVEFDHYWGESFYSPYIGDVVTTLKDKKLLIESEGALVVPVEGADGTELPPCIIRKSDGATIYATRDIAAAIYREGQFHFDRMSYVVGGEQRLHFQQVFCVLKKAGFKWVERCEHIPFGLYRFQGAKMSTRKGNFVTLQEVLNETKDEVSKILEAREDTKNLSAAEKDVIVSRVAVGAIVFHDLFTDPIRDVLFDLEKVLSFEGDTGPYVQYAYTRCESILKKSGTSNARPQPAQAVLLVHEAELRLLKTLGRFPQILDRMLDVRKPSGLAHYLLEVAGLFGTFYHDCPVLTSSGDLKTARLGLVEATRRVLGQGLSLLGIPLTERM